VCYIADPGEAPLRAGEFRRMRVIKAHDYDVSGDLTDDVIDESSVMPMSVPPAFVQIRPAVVAR